MVAHDELMDHLPGRHTAAAAATVTPDATQVSARGLDGNAELEIGSVSKALTGMLFREAVERGEVTPRTTLGELLPLAGAPAARVTLGALAVHRSGLPGLPSGARPWRRALAYELHGTNPYGDTLAVLLEQTRGVEVGRPRPKYSNLGFQLLGHAVAARAGTSYADLLRTRLAEPLGITLRVPATPEDLPPDAVVGRDRWGRTVEPWTGEALAPAGGVRATIGSMALLVRALLDGTAPGVSALEPVEELAGRAVRIGAGWVVLERRGRTVAWHNGGTGGFRSWVGLDRAAGCGVAVLTARAVAVDKVGFELLDAVAA
jgi:CubicO group peptidase (beta-lactamase class C family)